MEGKLIFWGMFSTLSFPFSLEKATYLIFFFVGTNVWVPSPYLLEGAVPLGGTIFLGGGTFLDFFWAFYINKDNTKYIIIEI